jgi:hypothetical protein
LQRAIEITQDENLSDLFALVVDGVKELEKDLKLQIATSLAKNESLMKA